MTATHTSAHSLPFMNLVINSAPLSIYRHYLEHNDMVMPTSVTLKNITWSHLTDIIHHIRGDVTIASRILIEILLMVFFRGSEVRKRHRLSVEFGESIG